MGWIRKIMHLLIVVGVAALMSIPFKRVPPKETSNSGSRGEWQLDRPSLPFKFGGARDGNQRSLESRKPVIPSSEEPSPQASAPVRTPGTPATSLEEEHPGADRFREDRLKDDDTNDERIDRDRLREDFPIPDQTSLETPGTHPPVAVADLVSARVQQPRGDSSVGAVPVTDSAPQPEKVASASSRKTVKPAVAAIRDHERTWPMSTAPRIETQPPPPQRLDEGATPPALPAEFQAIDDSGK